MSRGGDCVKRSFVVRAVSIILVLLIAFSSVFVASAAEIRKVTKTYDIAVVFDNSGSMYMNGYTRWSQAKYAMEIFASMLDYKDGKGDKLTIYTMWPVCVDGTKTGEKTYQVEVSNEKDIDKIKNMYTVYDKVGSSYNNGTPYETVEEAYESLKANNKADEEWLIILTDGQFGSEKRTGTDTAWDRSRPLQQRLEEYTKSGVKVQYIGLDMTVPTVPEEKEDYETQKVEANGDFYVAKATTGTKWDIKAVLIDVCNMIFKRNELEDGLDDDELELDISMSKMIVFVQGDNDKSPVLKNSDDEVIPAYLDSGLRKHNDLSCNQVFNTAIKADTSLYGQVVTFENLPKGEYTLEYPGSQDKVKIFYEPDVDIKIDFFGKFGDNEEEKITQDTEVLYPGEYRVEYSVVDRITGEDVTKSPLMGENGVTDLKCIVEVKNGDKTSEHPVESGGKITLNAGDTAFFNVNGTYLTDYKISTEDNKDGFTFNISQFPKPLELEVDAEVEQDGDWYQLSKKDEWKPIKVSIKYGDKALTDEEMAKVVPSFTFSPEVAYTYKMLPGESAYAVYIGKDKDGKDADVATGSYKITASAEFVDEYERTVKTEKPDEESFAVRTQSLPAVIIEILLLILLITAIILFIMSRKVLPKDLIADKREFKLRGRNAGDGKYNYDRKGKSLRLESPPVPTDMYAECKVTLSLYPVDRRWTPSRRRKVGIKDITGPSMGVVRVRIDGTAYEKMENGRFAQRLSPEDPIKEESINPSIRIESKKNSVYDISLTSN